MNVEELMERVCADDLVRVAFTSGTFASTGLQPGLWQYVGRDGTDYGWRLWFVDPERPQADPVSMVATWLAFSAYSFEFAWSVAA